MMHTKTLVVRRSMHAERRLTAVVGRTQVVGASGVGAVDAEKVDLGLVHRDLVDPVSVGPTGSEVDIERAVLADAGQRTR